MKMLVPLVVLATVCCCWCLTWPSQHNKHILPQRTSSNNAITKRIDSDYNDIYKSNKSIADISAQNVPEKHYNSINFWNEPIVGIQNGGSRFPYHFNTAYIYNTLVVQRHHRRSQTRKNVPTSRRKRRRRKKLKKGYNIGNKTYERPYKRTLRTGGKNNTGRKSNYPNTGGGWSGGHRYRSVDPKRDKVSRYLIHMHNFLRSKVNPPAANMLALGWYERAAEQAQAWAEQCERNTNLDHPSVRWTSRYGACGQNLLVSTTKKRWSQVLAKWWSERRHFSYGDGYNNLSLVSSYTQMAWYNSHQLGCGFAQCSTTGTQTFYRYVCNYCPTGNDPRRLSRPYSKGKKCSMCPGSCRSLCNGRRCGLCTNSCAYSDLWNNCPTLNQEWHEWLCNTKTKQGVERFKNCRATCQCVKEIT